LKNRGEVKKLGEGSLLRVHCRLSSEKKGERKNRGEMVKVLGGSKK